MFFQEDKDFSHSFDFDWYSYFEPIIYVLLQ